MSRQSKIHAIICRGDITKKISFLEFLDRKKKIFS